MDREENKERLWTTGDIAHHLQAPRYCITNSVRDGRIKEVKREGGKRLYDATGLKEIIEVVGFGKDTGDYREVEDAARQRQIDKLKADIKARPSAPLVGRVKQIENEIEKMKQECRRRLQLKTHGKEIAMFQLNAAIQREKKLKILIEREERYRALRETLRGYKRCGHFQR